MVERVSAAEERARLLRAHRLHEARLLRATDDEEVFEIEAVETLEAEAGAVLAAERDDDIHRLRVIGDAWFDANKS